MVGISLATGLIICELSLRALGFQFGLYPTTIQFGYPSPQTLRAEYQIDRDLLWVRRDYRTKLQAARGRQFTVAFLGDSCTELGTYDKAFAAIVRERHPATSYAGLNLGVAGWSSYQGLQQFRRDVVPLRPRMVTLFFGWNDHWMTFGHEDKEIGQFNLEHPPLLLAASDNSRFVQLVNRAIFAYRQSGDARDDGRRPARVSLQDFRSNLTSIIRTARANGITPVLLTAPTSHRRGTEPRYLRDRWVNRLEDLVPLHLAYVEAVREVAAAEHAELVDLHATFDALAPERRDEYFLRDGIHLTPAGDQVIAEKLYEAMDGQIEF